MSHVHSGAVLAMLHVGAVLAFGTCLFCVISKWSETYESMVELHSAFAVELHSAFAVHLH